MEGDILDYARGLESKIIRNAIADCYEMVSRHDERILDNLKKAYSIS